MDATEQHVWHHQDQAGTRINTTLEKNTKGYNFSIVVVNAVDPDQALDLIEQTRAELALRYGDSELSEKIKKLEFQLDETETYRQADHRRAATAEARLQELEKLITQAYQDLQNRDFEEVGIHLGAAWDTIQSEEVV